LRDMLQGAMEAKEFAVYEPECWHYDYKNWKEYPILNIDFFRECRITNEIVALQTRLSHYKQGRAAARTRGS